MTVQVKPIRFYNGFPRQLKEGEEFIAPEYLGSGGRDASKILNGLGQWVNKPAIPGASLPSGVYLPFGGSVAPSGFLLCDGSAISRTVYADLFAAIGENYGVGNGSTTFNIPDFTNNTFPMGGTPGETGGNNTLNLQHNHSISSDGTHNHGGATGTPSDTTPTNLLVGAVASSTHTHSISSDGSHDHGSSTGNSLSNSQDIRPKYVAGNWIIKT